MTAFRWVALSSQDWMTPAGWDTGTVPDAGTDDAFITTAGSYDVRIAAGESVLVDSVELNAAGATLEVQGTLTLGGTSDTFGLAGGTLLLDAGGLVAAGTINATGGTLASQGGTLSGVTYQGALVLAGTQQALMLQNGLHLQADTAGSPGSIDLSGASNSGLFLLDSETLDNATLNFGTGAADSLSTGLGADSGHTLTLGSGFTVAVSGGNSFLGYQTGAYAVSDAGDTLDNAGLIAVSGGTLEIDYGSFNNSGSISVDGGTLTVQSTTTLGNTGSISVSNGGVLDLLETLSTAQLAGIAAIAGGTLEIGGSLDNSGQTLSVGPASALAAVLLSGTISGGVIADSGSGMAFAGGTLDAVTYQGTLDLTPQGSTLSIVDGLTLTGTGGTGPGALTLGNVSSLFVYDSQTLDNAVIDLAGGAAAINQSASPGNAPGALTLGANLTLQVAGSGDYLNSDTSTAGSLLSYGTVNLDGSSFFIQATTFSNAGVFNGGTSYLSVSAAGFVNTGTLNLGSANFQPAVTEFTNDGTMEMAAGGYFAISNADTFANDGVIDNAGQTTNITANDFSNAGRITGVDDAYFSVTAPTITNTASGTLTLASGASGDLYGGTAVNDGLLAIQNSGSNHFGINNTTFINNGTLNAQPGSGVVALSGQTVVNNGLLEAESGSSVFDFYGQTVVNNGTIEATNGDLLLTPTALTNAGDIVITGFNVIEPQSFTNAAGGTIGVAAGATLYFGGTTGWSNAGTILISSGAAVYLQGAITSTAQLTGISNSGTIFFGGTLDNTGQTLTIGTSAALGTVLLEGVTVIGGVVQSGAAGLLLNGATLEGVTYQGTLDLSASNTTLTASGGLTVTGTAGTGPGVVNLGSASSILFTGTQTFDNATVTLADSTLETQGGALTLGAGLTIDQTGSSDMLTASGPAGTMVNDGTIDGTDGQLTIQSQSFVNAGEVTVASGDVLEIASGNFSIAPGGTLIVQSGGTADVQTATWTDSGFVSVEAGGLLHLHGTLIAGQTDAVSDAGTILGGVIVDAGGSVVFTGGTLDGVTYQGALDLTPDATLHVSDLALAGIGGSGPGAMTLSAGSNVDFVSAQTLDNANVTLAGSGDIVGLDSSVAGALILGANLALTQTGLNDVLTANAGTIVNDGSISLSAGTGSLTIAAASVTNAGQIAVGAGETLDLQAQGFTNAAGGTLALAPGSAVDLGSNWSNAGAIDLGAGAALYLHGTVTPAQIDSIDDTGGTIYLNGSVLDFPLVVVGSVVPPDQAWTGQEVPITWSLTNTGVATAVGPWSDEVFLASDAAGDNLIPLGTVAFTGTLAPGQTITRTGTVTVPGTLATGSEWFVVRTDSADQLVEPLTDAERQTAAAAPTEITHTPTLVAGISATGTLAAGQASYYQVQLNAGQSIDLSLATNQPTAVNALVVGYGVFPTSSQSVVTPGTQGVADPAAILTAATAGTYYIAVNDDSISGGEAYTLTATAVPFLLTGVTSASGSDLGSATVTIRGADFNANEQVQLVVADGTVRDATSVTWAKSNELWATFNLQGLPLGTYDLEVSSGTLSAALPDSFQVTNGPTGAVSTNVSAQSPTQAGGTGTVQVTYTNTGQTDVTAPILDLGATDALLNGGNVSSSSGNIVFLGTNPGGPAGILQPGATDTVTFTYTATSPNQTPSFSVGTLLPSDSTNGQTIWDSVWSSLESTAQPPTVDVTDWHNAWNDFVGLVGTTTASVENALSKAATELSQVGQTTGNVATLLQYELFQASGAMAGTYLTAASDIAPTASPLSLSLNRYYDGTLLGRDATGEFGDGWTSNYDVTAVADASGNVYIQSPGVLHDFTLQADGTYTAAAGDTAMLTVVNGLYQMTDGSGNVERFLEDGKLASVTDPHGNVVSLTYGSAGVLQQVASSATGETITFTSNAQGRITSATDSNGEQVTYTYNAAGTQLLSATGPDGTTTYSYVAPTGTVQDNALTGITNPDGTQTSFAYNSQGWLARESGTGGAGLLTYTYGPGQVTVTNAAGNSSTFRYGLNGAIAQTQDALGNVSQLQYGSTGLLTGVVTPDNSTSGVTYDSAGNLTEYIDPLGGTVTATYAPGTQELTTLTNQAGAGIRYTYDAAGDVTGITYQDGSGDTYRYNTEGLLTSKTDANGNTITYSYDSAGGLTRETFSDGTYDSYTYDNRGNLTSATRQSGATTTYTYNTANQLTSVTDPSGQVESYTYNTNGQLATRTEPGGSVVQYSYTPARQLSELTDGSGHLVDQYFYNTDGQLIETLTGSGASTHYQYDADGRTTQILNLNANGSTASYYDYTYNADSQVTAENTSDGNWSYSYDAAGELTRAVFQSSNPAIQNQDIAYTYDAAGNRVSQTINGVVSDYTTNALNQYTQVGDTAYAYDANGNLISETNSSGKTTFTYNENNQLIAETGPEGSFQYSYDALGNLVSETDNGVTTNFVNDPLSMSVAGTPLTSIAQVYNSGGTLASTYDYGLGLAAVMAASGSTYYYNSDLTGNVTGRFGSNGTLSNSYFYLPFGQLMQASGAAGNPFQFAGAFGDPNSDNGPVLMHARAYVPELGRFVSEDPTGIVNGINLYTYVNNDPIDNVDPIGLSTLQVGIGGSINLIPGLSLSLGFGVAIDNQGNVGLYGYVGGGSQLGEEEDAGINVETSNAVNINDLSGPFGGISLHGGLGIGGSGNYFTGNSPDGPVKGGGFIVGEAAGASLSGGFTDTSVVPLFSIGNLLRKLFGGSPFSSSSPPSSPGGPTAQMFPDPHLVTFDGLFYSFQTAGEFVLVKNTDGGTFQVQARLSAPVGASIYSVITEVGVQVGRDVVTIDSTRAAPVWVDGEAVAFSGNSIGLADGGITRTATGYVVTLDTGESVTANINSFGTQTGPSTTSGGLSISVSLAPDAAHDSVEGLLGNYNGNPNNDLTLANGTVEPTDMSSATLYGVYADSWRVTQATSLLNYGPGQTTATFTDTGFPETPVSISSFPTAEVAAATQLVEQAGITDPGLQQAAIYDYLVTGDPAVVSVESNLQQQGATTSTQAQIAPSTSPSEEVGVLATTMSEAESASGTTTAPFDIYREGDTSQALVVNYSVTTPGSTYLAASDFGGSLPAGQVTLEAGQTLAPLSIVIPDGIGAVPTADLAVAITAGTSVAVISPFAQETIVNAAPVAGPQPAFGVEIANESSAQPLQSGNSWRFDLGAFKEASATSPGTLSLAVLNLAAAGSDSMEGLLLASDSAGLPTSATSGFEPVQPGNMIDIANIAVDKTSLGVNTEQFVITPYDLNASGYVAIMAQQTVTVTDTVYPLAQALLSTTTIDFGVVRGGSVEQQAIGIENHGPVGAEALDAGVGALTGAATGSGSFTLLAVGQTSTAISVGLNTSGGGVVTGTAAIDPYSDGANTDGLGATALLPQAVTVSGTVYREAQAGITLVQPILHVGDSGTDALIVSNVDPADGYSENLIATLAGATGGFSSAGTGPTGDVAAGSTNSTALAVTFSTSQAGTISGAVTLDVTTDGGTGPGSIDGFGELARAPETFALSATIDNYATAEIVQLSGPGMLSASGDMFRLDFGKVGIGSAPESVDLGLENAASATADLLAGSFVASGDPALVLSGFSAFAGVAAQQILSGLNVTLDTNQAGLFTQVITLDPTGYNASGYEGALAPEVITVAGTVDNGPTLAPGMLTIGHGQSEMVTGLLDSLITPGLPGDSETIVAVSGNAALANGVVTYAAPGSGPDSFTYQVEDQLGDIATGTVDVTVDPGPVAATGSLTVGHGQTVSLTSLIDGLVTPGLAGDSETISAVSAVSGEISLSPAGAVTYEAPAGGSDTVDYTATDQLGDSATGTVAVTIDPGPMARTLDTTVTLGAAVNLTSAILGVVAPGLPGDMLLLSGDGTLDTLGTVTLASGQLTYTAGGEVLNQIPANGSQADSFTYTVTDEYGDVATGTVDVTVTNPAVVIDGPILGFGTIVAAPRATIVNAYAFDNVIFDEGGNDIVNAGQGLATVYVNTGNAVVNLSGYDNVVTGFDEPGTSAAVGANGNVRVSGSQGLTSVDLGNGNDTVLLGGSFNVITLGNGADSVNAGQGFGTIRLGNGNDQVTLGGLANSVVAGDGNDAVSGSQGLTSVTLGNGTENVLLVGSGNLIQVGNGNDTIVAGSGSDQVVAGSGNDTITLQGRSNVVTLSAGSDTIQAGSADTITLDSARLLLSGGSQEMVFLGSGAASLDDLSSATTLAAGPSSGSCDILDFAHDTGFVLDLTGGVGGYTSVAQAISALQSDGDGGTQLLLGSGPGAAVIDFVNTRASGLTPNHFRIG